MDENKDKEEKKQEFDIASENHYNEIQEDVEFVDEEEEKNPLLAIKKLRERLKQSQKERQEYLDGWQRMKADAVNGRRQDEEWRKEFVKFAEEKLISRLLPVLESFGMAMANKEAWEALPKDWRLGVEHINRELVSALSEHGLSEINPEIATMFDPKLQTTVSSVHTDDKNLDHSIASVVQRGYAVNGKVLKPARVNIFDLNSE